MTQNSEEPATSASMDVAASEDVETKVAENPYRLVASPLLVGGPAPGGGLTGGPGIGTTWLALGGPGIGDTGDAGDARTATAAQAALDEEPMLGSETTQGIEVVVNGTAVTLLGRVATAADRDMAERVVSRLPEVSTVDNRLEIGGE